VSHRRTLGRGRGQFGGVDKRRPSWDSLSHSRRNWPSPSAKAR
jgi:hypothetical protein